MYSLLAPPKKSSTLDWVNTKRYLSPKNCARPGKFSTDLVPYLDDILNAIDDPGIPVIVCKKSAQWAWTDGVICNVIGKRIDHQDEGTIVAMFPREKSAKDFEQEKFRPMVEATPSLSEKVDLRVGTRAGNTTLRKSIGVVMLKLVGSNSPSEVKSTSAPITIVEEPDDANGNVQGQGNTIKLLKERSKTFDEAKSIFGGTPTITGLSQIDDAYENSDQRSYWVVCHACKESHVLDFRNLHCEGDRWETTIYSCPYCGSEWSDNQRINNIYNSRELKRQGHTQAGWIAAKEFRGVAGFAGNELMSAFRGSRISELMRKWIEAKKKFDQGDDADLIAFTNASMGLSYDYPKDTPPTDELQARSENYSEFTVPVGGLIITVGVDIQHDRIAIIIRAWGRGEESWLVYWGEIYGDTSVSIRDGKPIGPWLDLWMLLTMPVRHELGCSLKVKAISVDSSDGQRSDAVYQFVRAMNGKHSILVMAIKGSSKDKMIDVNVSREIFTPAKAIDVKASNKYSKYGVQVHIVGTSMAKDLILGARLKLTGNGPGVIHFYQDVRADYFEQLVSEVKAPRRGFGRQKFWQPLSGVRNEVLDCECYCLHAARALRINLWSPRRWDQEEIRISQLDLLDTEVEVMDIQAIEPQQPNKEQLKTASESPETTVKIINSSTKKALATRLA
ncbi:MAG: terminase gpA endonuclease subunit [Methylococcales bacterium]